MPAGLADLDALAVVLADRAGAFAGRAAALACAGLLRAAAGFFPADFFAADAFTERPFLTTLFLATLLPAFVALADGFFAAI